MQKAGNLGPGLPRMESGRNTIEFLIGEAPSCVTRGKKGSWWCLADRVEGATHLANLLHMKSRNGTAAPTT